MRVLVSILTVCSVVGVVAAIFGWQEVARLRAANGLLMQQLKAAESNASDAAAAVQAKHQAEIEQLQREAREVHKLRGEVNRLRGGADSLAQLQETNRRLQAENRSLRESATESVANAPSTGQGLRSFPRESWEFLGYTSPEDALVSAIWTMQQGDPQAYFDSLAPSEQERMAERWQDKTESEISTKHQSDVAAITGLQVLNRRDVSDNKVMMDVYIEGPGRMQRVSMRRIDDEWKFAGYVELETP
ncbi:MAG: hypothetical protein M2R45_00231 [Verrucomicrobia subdivision 3 bacterium]|nr:hypothetical protein [Limisphaerales bacterium]MCS1412311.1 hypothetical protein [Limisphaerales bacterium]